MQSECYQFYYFLYSIKMPNAIHNTRIHEPWKRIYKLTIIITFEDVQNELTLSSHELNKNKCSLHTPSHRSNIPCC